MKTIRNGLRDQLPTRFLTEKEHRSGVKGMRVLQHSGRRGRGALTSQTLEKIPGIQKIKQTQKLKVYGMN
jgi:hypothetical protein